MAPRAPANASFRYALLRYIKSPASAEGVVESNDSTIIIQDAYPKARHHYLLLFRASLQPDFPCRVDQLTQKHLPLLREAKQTIHSFIARHIPVLDRTGPFQIQLGFHALPSMNHLHIHIITTDFISDRIKRKEHYVSFNSSFFITLERVFVELEAGRRIVIDEADMESMCKRTALTCCRCGALSKNLPSLKHHLQECRVDPSSISH